jgi:RimJ/RimL family protein N-acetyltransferase
MDYSFSLAGQHIRLEPLSENHTDGLVGAAVNENGLYRWSPVPQTREQAMQYIRTASSWREERTGVPFAIVNASNGTVIGSTRFWQLEYWSWPPAHNRHGRNEPDVCEIGYTWLTTSAVRTAANTEAKLLMLTYAFEKWQVFRVCFHADSRNERSIAALTKLGATREGVLRAHRMSVDYYPRNSVRFSILAEDWPTIKDRLIYRLTRHSDVL